MEGEEASEDDAVVRARALSVTERVQHTHWKARMEAYQLILDAANDPTNDSNQQALNEFAPLAHRAVADGNPNALEAAINAVHATINAAGEATWASEIAEKLVTKGLGCGKPKAVKAATETLMVLVEAGYASSVTEALIEGTGARAPKTAAASISTTKSIITSFGPQALPVKPIVKSMPALFEHKDKKVREEAKNLAGELAAWLGVNALRSPLLDNLRETQRKEVEDMVSTMDPREQPERRLRKANTEPKSATDGNDRQKPKPSVGNKDGKETWREEGEQRATGASSNADLDLNDAVDLSWKLKQKRGEDPPAMEALEAQQWKTRHDALMFINEVACKPKIMDGEFRQLVGNLEGIISRDSNINCVAEAAKVVSNLAKGLGTSFKDHGRQLSWPVIAKLKEKKTNVCNSLLESLSAMCTHSLSLLDIFEDLASGVQDKNPQIEMYCLRFIGEHSQINGLSKKEKSKLVPKIAPLAASAMKHSDSNVRDAACAALAGFAISSGDASIQSIEKFIEGIDSAKKKKLEAMINQDASKPAHSRGSQLLREGQPPTKRAATGSTDSKASENQSESLRSSSASTREKAGSSTRQAKQSRQSAQAAKRAGGNEPKESRNHANEKANQIQDDPVTAPTGSRVTAAEAEERLISSFGESSINDLKSSDWKARLNAVGQIYAAVEEERRINLDDLTGECILLALFEEAPGWNEKNHQVMQQMVKIATSICEQSDSASFTKKHASILVDGIVARLADAKIKSNASEALISMSRRVHPRYIATGVQMSSRRKSSPKVQAESMLWLIDEMSIIGIESVGEDNPIAAATSGLSASNPQVKQAAIRLVGEIHRQIGDKVKGRLGEIKPALMQQIDKECESKPCERGLTHEAKSKASLDTSDQANKVAESNEKEKEEEDGDNEAEKVYQNEKGTKEVDEIDISEIISNQTFSQTRDEKWQERENAIEQICNAMQKCIDSKKQVNTIPSDLSHSLKERLSDSHKNLVSQSIQALSLTFTCAGQNGASKAKQLAPDIAVCFSDGKAKVRESTAKCLASICDILGDGKGLQIICGTLASPRALSGVEGRRDATSWVRNQVHRLTGEELNQNQCGKELVRFTATGLGHKSAEVRKEASSLTSVVLEKAGSQIIREAAVNALPPEFQNLIVNQIGDSNPVDNQQRRQTEQGHRQAQGGSESPAKGQAKARQHEPASQGSERGNMGTTTVADSSSKLVVPKGEGKEARLRQTRRRQSMRVDDGPWGEELAAGLYQATAGEVRDQMLGDDFKGHIEAAAKLEGMLDDDLNAVVANLDLVLRWVRERLMAQAPSTQVLLKLMSLTETICTKLEKNNMRVDDAEAGIIATPITDLCGHSFDAVRTGARRTLQAMKKVIPPSRWAGHLNESVKAKGSKPRVECINELGSMLGRHGADQIERGPGKGTLTTIASMANAKECATRRAAIDALNKCIEESGNRVFDHIDMEANEMNQLRLKLRRPGGNRTNESAPQSPQQKGTRAPSTPTRSRRRSANEEDASSRALQTPKDKRRQEQEEQGEQQGMFTKSPAPTREGKVGYHELMRRIEEEEGEGGQALKGMYFLLQNANEGDPIEGVDLKQESNKLGNKLVECAWTSMQMHMDTKEKQSGVTTNRELKYSMHCLIKLFENAEAAVHLSEQTVRHMLKSTVGMIVHSSSRDKEETSSGQVVDALNLVSLKLLNGCPMTFSTCAALDLIGEANNEESAAQKAELYVKCLIKLAKSMDKEASEGSTGVNINKILSSISSRLMEERKDEDVSRNDRVRRIVKTMMHELCRRATTKHIDEAIESVRQEKGHSAANALEEYTSKLMKRQQGNQGAKVNSNDDEPNDMEAIFRRISMPGTCSRGLDELAEHLEKNRDADVNEHVRQTSESFQRFLDVQLRRRGQSLSIFDQSQEGEGGLGAGAQEEEESKEGAQAEKPTLDAHRKSLEDLRLRMERISARKGSKTEGKEEKGKEEESKDEDKERSASLASLQQRLSRIQALKERDYNSTE